MTYKEFKEHFQDRAIKEYGFKSIGSRVYYINDEVFIVFDIVKSSYSNSLSRFDIGINPIQTNLYKMDKIEQVTSDGSELVSSLVKGPYVELDDINDFEYYDKIFDDFFQNTFPKLITLKGIKEMILSNKLYARDRIKSFLNIK